MSHGLLVLAGISLMAGALFLVPLGLPGVWIMILVLAIATYLGEVGPGLFAVLSLVAGVAEVAEYFLVSRFSRRYGGSRGAFWGALLGGLAGVLVGLPVPLIGPVLAGLLGTFLGAGAVTLLETRRLPDAGRVGWGVVVGRVFSAFVKMAAGIVVLVAGSLALLAR